MKSQSKNPKQEWRIVKRSNQTGLKSIVIDTGDAESGVWSPNQTKGTRIIETAYQMTAAPELLEALNAMIPYYEACAIGNEHDLIIKQARAAIAKATGK